MRRITFSLYWLFVWKLERSFASTTLTFRYLVTFVYFFLYSLPTIFLKFTRTERNRRNRLICGSAEKWCNRWISTTSELNGLEECGAIEIERPVRVRVYMRYLAIDPTALPLSSSTLNNRYELHTKRHEHNSEVTVVVRTIHHDGRHRFSWSFIITGIFFLSKYETAYASCCTEAWKIVSDAYGREWGKMDRYQFKTFFLCAAIFNNNW